VLDGNFTLYVPRVVIELLQLNRINVHFFQFNFMEALPHVSVHEVTSSGSQF